MSSQATIYCKMQNRLGAMDRVLAAFTHRGIIPGRFASSHDEQSRAVELVVTFDCADAKVLDKLVKFLQKQVYVLETKMFAHAFSSEFAAKSAPDGAIHSNKVATLFTTDVTPERKVAHAHNA
jgi:hypothetical protein